MAGPAFVRHQIRADSRLPLAVHRARRLHERVALCRRETGHAHSHHRDEGGKEQGGDHLASDLRSVLRPRRIVSPAARSAMANDTIGSPMPGVVSSKR